MTDEIGSSKYARKVESGKQMYGPGCCGHKKPPRHMQKAVDELRKTQPNLAYSPLKIAAARGDFADY